MPAQALARSYLYVPGHRVELIDKAQDSPADAVIIDLEDAVPPAHKADARAGAADALSRPARVPLWVRINSVASGLAADDIASLAGSGSTLAGVRLAKAESALEVRAVVDLLADAGLGDCAIHCLIESAQSLENIAELARASPAVGGIALGEADLAADLGTAGDDGLLYARSRCVVAARAAGLAPPIQSVFANVDDQDALRASTEVGRRLGFVGRTAIHPRQLAVINDVYTPSAQVVAAARELIDQLEQASAQGSTAFVLPDGRFVDPAVVQSAARTLELAARIGRAR